VISLCEKTMFPPKCPLSFSYTLCLFSLSLSRATPVMQLMAASCSHGASPLNLCSVVDGGQRDHTLDILREWSSSNLRRCSNANHVCHIDVVTEGNGSTTARSGSNGAPVRLIRGGRAVVDEGGAFNIHSFRLVKSRFFMLHKVFWFAASSCVMFYTYKCDML
jgi:hypothetical protein